jgi:hypothetical protein
VRAADIATLLLLLLTLTLVRKLNKLLSCDCA